MTEFAIDEANYIHEFPRLSVKIVPITRMIAKNPATNIKILDIGETLLSLSTTVAIWVVGMIPVAPFTAVVTDGGVHTEGPISGGIAVWPTFLFSMSLCQSTGINRS